MKIQVSAGERAFLEQFDREGGDEFDGIIADDIRARLRLIEKYQRMSPEEKLAFEALQEAKLRKHTSGAAD